MLRQWSLADLRPLGAPMTAEAPLGDRQQQFVAAGTTGDGTRVVAVRGDAVLEWDANGHSALNRGTATVDGLVAIAASPTDDDVIALTNDGRVIPVSRDGPAGEPHPSGVTAPAAIAALGDGTVAVGGRGLAIVDVHTGERRTSRDDLEVVAVATSEDTRDRLAVATSDGQVRVVSSSDLSDTAGPFATGHDELIDLALAPDGSSVAIGNDDDDTSDLTVIDTATGEVRQLAGHGAKVTSVEFSPDGKTLASGSDDRTILLTSTDDWSPLGVLTGHDDLVRHLAFSARGDLLLSASDDGTMRWWDVAAQTAVGLPIRWDPNAFGEVASGADLAASEHGSTIAFWDTEPEAWLRMACSIAPRLLSDAEQRTYFNGRQPPEPCADVAGANR
jgi:hypothetical protein